MWRTVPRGTGRVLAADLAVREARHRLAADLHRAQVVDVRHAERGRREQAGDVMEPLERDLAADERADGSERGRLGGAPAALVDKFVVEGERVAVGPLLAREAARGTRHVQGAYTRDGRRVAHRDEGHAGVEAGGVHPALDVVRG